VPAIQAPRVPQSTTRISGSTVVTDKAYLGRGNFEGASELGMDGYIPFKSNSRGLSHGSPIWNRMYHEFMAGREEFEEVYHRRSNVEATFSAIKRKLGEPLLSHNDGARINELLAKILTYNIGIVIQQSEIHALHPGRSGSPRRLPESRNLALAPSPIAPPREQRAGTRKRWPHEPAFGNSPRGEPSSPEDDRARARLLRRGLQEPHAPPSERGRAAGRSTFDSLVLI
jgi:hypothetical protein